MLRAYRRYAPVYDFLFGPILEQGRIAMAQAVRVASPKTILEVGVGTGLALARYPTNATAIGVDLSLHMLNRASSLARRQGVAADLICADAEQLPLADSSFDCVTLPYVLSVTPDPWQLMAELRRVCMPGGNVFILNHFKGAGVWTFSERIVEPLADKIGFRSDLSLESIESEGWAINSVNSVNLFGLSKLVSITNGNA